MPRIRTIKPEFWVDEKVVELSPWARLLFIGMWNFADDQGYIDYSPKRIRMQIFPGDTVDIDALIGELLDSGMVRAYESPIGPVLHITNWSRHQRVDKASKPRFDPSALRPYGSPPAAVREDSQPLAEPEATPPGVFRETSANPRESSCAEKDQEGKGREVPPTAERAALAVIDGELATTQPEPPTTTDALVAEWLRHCHKRPPRRVIGHISREVKAMLAEGIDPADVRRGLAAWHSRGLHPSTLPSVVNEVMNAGPARPAASISAADGQPLPAGTSNSRMNDAMRLAAHYAALDGTPIDLTTLGGAR